RLEPLRDLVEPLRARRLGETGVHLSELVSLALDGRLEVQLGRPDRHVGDRVTSLLQEIEVTERMPGLGLRGVAEQPADIRISFDVRPASEIQVSPVRLRLTRERGLQVLVGVRALERLRHRVPPIAGTRWACPAPLARNDSYWQQEGALSTPDRRQDRPSPRTLARERIRSSHACTCASDGSNSKPSRPKTIMRGANAASASVNSWPTRYSLPSSLSRRKYRQRRSSSRACSTRCVSRSASGLRSCARSIVVGGMNELSQ